MNFLNIHFLLFFLFLMIQLNCKTVSLKFNEFQDIENLKKSNSNNKDINIFSELYDYLLYTIITIGEPNQLTLGFYNSDSSVFVINNNEKCKQKENYNYSYTNSQSSEIVRKVEGDYYFPGYLIINETLKIDTIANNTKKSEEIKDFQFKYEEPKKSWGKEDDTNKIFCADIGFQIEKETETKPKFFKELKEKKIISSYTITMNYTSNNEGYFYIGDFPHEYDQNNFKEYQLTSTYMIPRTSFSRFRIVMDNIYIPINETKIYNITQNEVFFNLDSGLIECPVDYFNFIRSIFFKEYFNKSICEMELMTKNLNKYYMIVCKEDNSFNIKSFPTIYFHHFELNKTFNLDYNDLFLVNNNKYYFLIIYSSFSGSYWKLGKPFLKKYQITLDIDSKKIYFYNNFIIDNKEGKVKDEKNNNSLNLREILIISFCSVICVILVVVLIKGLKKKRKKRANELKDDDYEYSGIENNTKDNETNQNQIIDDNNNDSNIIN